jgi:hypothetical protein
MKHQKCGMCCPRLRAVLMGYLKSLDKGNSRLIHKKKGITKEESSMVLMF